ncbi:multidrug effflux MFS transporter [Caulobacter sp. 17J80-11]|uniref:multidrug effflux MFS transporter n=1 Tax=Caulobacter sp. 17J80-11 TaxID=2763502 RepID=UPI0016535AC0|nr:multidrug effflux MFS transporter [Caulobacter sp. 17J80-11]MBC6982780.1 multidrug effflux MFS transporter [Caulobacter sp. 17J80-11]
MTSPAAASAPRAVGAPFSLLLILGALTAFSPMSIDMYLPSLPAIARDLHGTATGAQQTVAAFFVGLALGQLIYGPLSDRIGRRGPLLAGIALYLVATVGCAFAPTMPALVGLRFVQALGGCAGVVVARAVVRDRFDHQESARVFSVLMLIMGVAPILAPLAGGWIMAATGWRTIFWALFAFGAATGVAVLFGLPESRSEATAARARAETPLAAYLALLKNRGVMAFILAGGLTSAAMFTYIAASPELVIETYGVPATRFGWVFGANAVGIIGASQLNRLVLRRHAPDQVLRASALCACAAALLLLAAALTEVGGLLRILVPLFFAIAAQGFSAPNAVASALALDPARAGSLSALFGAVQFGLGATGAALVGVFHDGSAVPMATVIAVCTMGAVAALRLAPKP